MRSHIRTRLAVAMAVPVAVLVLVAAFQALASWTRLSNARATGAAGAEHTAMLDLGLWALTAVAALVFGAGAVLRVSHSITAPLVRLSAYAEDLAEHRMAAAVRTILAGGELDESQMPQPPAVDGDDEVGSVAKALLAVQERALSLAVEQSALRHDMADALTNLGRRNQNLLSRQLDYITSIEKSETDPDKLDQLFKLDHLATRMRRNAESLLVLGGAESPRQWSAPVPVVDVVRSALAEVEDFRRVTLGSIASVALAGRATSDLAHLVAELVENGLSYSPPHTEVRIDGALRDGGYLLTITDRGLGMDADGLAQANGRLAGDEAFAGSPSRYLGLYVTGQLAARHGVRVSLEPGTASGTVAQVALPAALLPELTPAPGGAPAGATPTAAGLASRIHPGTPGPGADARPGPAPAPAAAASRPLVTRAAASAGAQAIPARAAAPSSAGRRADSRPQPAPAARNGDLIAMLEEPAGKARARRRRPEPASQPTPPRHAAAQRAVAPTAEPATTPAHRRAAAPDEAPAPVAAPLAPVGRREEPVAVARPVAPSLPAAAPVPPPAPEPEPEHSFESWLDSRLEQLTKLSVEQAVTATPPRPVEPSAAPAGGGGQGGSGLPQRRPGAVAEAGLTGLRRRPPAGDGQGGTPAADAPRVSSSLFRYLSAVDQRTNDPSQEGTSR
ncbi:MAG TPA: ATP-binding protein [Acidimicrobiales bacterium]|nr:ATP-binding protein [Acidimicrobiales bacterium]